MARKADIQYVHHYYTAGTAARKVAVKAEPKKKPIPLFEPRVMAPDQKISIGVDPLGLCATVVAVALVAMMVVSLFQYSAAHQRKVALKEYAYTLSDENVRLEQRFTDGLDLNEIEVQALALGMIPIEEAETIQVSGIVPAHEAEPTLWARMGLFLSGLFA